MVLNLFPPLIKKPGNKVSTTKAMPIPVKTFFFAGESGPRGKEREAVLGLFAIFSVVGSSLLKGDCDSFSFCRLSFASSLAWHEGQSGVV